MDQTTHAPLFNRQSYVAAEDFLDSQSLGKDYKQMAAERAEEDIQEQIAERKEAFISVPGGEKEAMLGDVYQELTDLLDQEAEMVDQLRILEDVARVKRRPIEERLEDFREQIKMKQLVIQVYEHESTHDMPPAAGPAALSFVDSSSFGALCNVVVALNLLAMWYHSSMPKVPAFIFDQVCLAWYVAELSCKYSYHQRNLFFGNPAVVWWNWMDAGIVVSGVIDQWIMPIMSTSMGLSVGNLKALRCLRLLRLFRIMRVLKIVKALFLSDLSWTTSPYFETGMAMVIAANSVVMGLELDIRSPYWTYVENTFLVIYLFELLASLRRWGLQFFVHPELWQWHWLDFSIVSGAVLDLWLAPLVHATMAMMSPDTHDNEHHSGTGVGGIMKLVRMMRLLRVLRLVKLFRKIPPLYILLLGVMDSMDAMKWVMVLTLLVLYACAVIFCTLVSQGVLYPMEDIPEEAEAGFGSMGKSMFSLFRLMNGDTSVVKGITDHVGGQLLFAGFMVLANWAILAILTSVVSDHMISASHRAIEEAEAVTQAENQKRNRERLLHVFEESDQNGSGTISKAEWDHMMADEHLRGVLQEATSLHVEDLEELHHLVSGCTGDDRLDYDDFVALIENEGKTCDRRAILKVMSRMQQLENLMHGRFEVLGDDMSMNTEKVRKHLSDRFLGGTSSDQLQSSESFSQPVSSQTSPSACTEAEISGRRLVNGITRAPEESVEFASGDWSELLDQHAPSSPSSSKRSTRKPGLKKQRSWHMLSTMKMQKSTEFSEQSKGGTRQNRQLYEKIGKLHDKSENQTVLIGKLYAHSENQQLRIAEMERLLKRSSLKTKIIL